MSSSFNLMLFFFPTVSEKWSVKIWKQLLNFYIGHSITSHFPHERPPRAAAADDDDDGGDWQKGGKESTVVKKKIWFWGVANLWLLVEMYPQSFCHWQRLSPTPSDTISISVDTKAESSY